MAITALLSTPNSLASSYTRTFATTLPASARSPGPVSRSGAAHAPSGVSSCCSSPLAHRALITVSACLSGLSLRPTPSGLPCIDTGTLRRKPYREPRPFHGHCDHAQAGVCSGLRQIPGKPFIGQRPGHAQRTRESPATPGLLQTFLTGMQVCSPAWTSRQWINDDFAVNRHHAEQVGLDGTSLTPHAGTDHRSGHDERRRPHSRPPNSLQGRRVRSTSHLARRRCLRTSDRPVTYIPVRGVPVQGVPVRGVPACRVPVPGVP